MFERDEALWDTASVIDDLVFLQRRSVRANSTAIHYETRARPEFLAALRLTTGSCCSTVGAANGLIRGSVRGEGTVSVWLFADGGWGQAQLRNSELKTIVHRAEELMLEHLWVRFRYVLLLLAVVLVE